jgi:DNA-binding MarR family transcriptional regulator
MGLASPSFMACFPTPHADRLPFHVPDLTGTGQVGKLFCSELSTCIVYNKHSYYIDGMSDDLGFLLGDAGRLLRRSFDERARAMGVTRPQWRVLALLKRFDGSTQVTIADMLEVEPITLGRMIDRLQDAELVERRADPKDRRAWRLHLTAKGRAKIKELEPTASAMFVDALQGIDEAKQAELEDMLNIIRSNLSRKPMEAANG